uniref:Uncharacterized protein n=1 Tax=Arundo donax TaxID=35708 RepID=A0A0A9H3G3_ARUDO
MQTEIFLKKISITDYCITSFCQRDLKNWNITKELAMNRGA